MTLSEPISQVERGVSEPSAQVTRPQGQGTGLHDELMGVVLVAAPANVIMQLALPGVGYGVMESRVESGRIDRHPIKRARTTLTYLAVARWGNEEQKRALREAVDAAHAQVRSTPDSAVKYNAFDPNLQLWVAACLYKGAVDIYRTFVGEMDDEAAERHYRESVVLGTTLQMPAEMWPADRAAFDKYWNEQLEKIHIDEPVRKFLYRIAVARFPGLQLPGPLQRVPESIALLITTGFLPQRFRDEMHLDWSPAKQRQFDALMTAIRFGNNLVPSFVRAFPFNVLLHDVDWRMRTGRPLV
jgi:uncharacterized protein (DUF2236 family)